jgi:hypothetical protein
MRDSPLLLIQPLDHDRGKHTWVSSHSKKTGQAVPPAAARPKPCPRQVIKTRLIGHSLQCGNPVTISCLAGLDDDKTKEPANPSRASDSGSRRRGFWSATSRGKGLGPASGWFLAGPMRLRPESVQARCRLPLSTVDECSSGFATRSPRMTCRTRSPKSTHTWMSPTPVLPPPPAPVTESPQQYPTAWWGREGLGLISFSWC